VIVEKAGAEAVAHFKNFHASDNKYTMPFSEAKQYCNLTIFDQARGGIIFDLAKTKL